MRRATERSEKRQEQRGNQTRPPRSSLRPQAKSSSKAKKKTKASKGKQASAAHDPMRQMPNWLMGTLALLALLFVVIPQGLPPAREINNTSLLFYLSHTSAFAIFAYFLCTWLLRRGTANAVLLTASMVLPLACGVEISKVMQLNQDLWRSSIFLPLALTGGAGGLWLASAVENARAKMRQS